MTPRRQAATIAAFCLSGAAGLALLRVVEDVAGPVFAVWLAVFGAMGR